MKHLPKISEKACYAVEIVGVGALTGLFAGLAVTLFNALAVLLEEFSRGYYGFFRDNPAFIPLLFLALFAGGIVMGGVLRVMPLLRGSGFPQAEGASTGLLRFKWYRDLTGMFAASLFAVFMGLSAGVEGPSVFLGACTGQGVSDILRRGENVRRYGITGGACAGLAVALKAPLSGIIFAYEEAHKKFNTEVFICSFTSVVFAMVVRYLLSPCLNLSNEAFFAGFSLPDDAGLMFCVYALCAALPTSLLAVGFYHATVALSKLFKKLRGRKKILVYAIPFLLAGGCGLLTPYAMGGGVETVEALAAGSGEELSLFGLPLFAVLLTVIAVRFVANAANNAALLPCCCSVPMMLMGAALGKLFALLFVKIGMDPALSDALVVMCLATFFTAVVKAPITGVILTVEVTWDFTFLLPAVICSLVAYLVGSVLKTEPLYEKILESDLLPSHEKTPLPERGEGERAAQLKSETEADQMRQVRQCTK